MLLSRVLAFLLLAACSNSQAADQIQVDPISHHLVDQHGNVRIYHGVNIVHKLTPYHPIIEGSFDVNDSLVAQDVDALAELGMNVVRLGVMWPGVEPTRNQYNSSYLKVMQNIVQKLGDAGISTIVDFHQDVLHEQYCGEGVPSYIMDMLKPRSTCNWFFTKVGLCWSFSDYFKLPTDPSTGYPDVNECKKTLFGYYYGSPEVGSAFQNLYSDSAVQKRLEQYWITVASAFKDSPHVLGYDLINEPFPGDILSHPRQMMPGVGDAELLAPLYEKLNAAIRSVDSDKIVFYEPFPVPATLPLFGGIESPVGFQDVPGGAADYANRSALSYHIYSCVSGAGVCDSVGNVLSKYDKNSNKYVKKSFDIRKKDWLRLGGGGFLTEFGACPNTEACIKEINRVTAAADDHFQSWAYWQYKFNDDVTTISGPEQGFYEPDGSLQEKVAALSRPYASIIAGKPISMHYSVDTSVFRLLYQPRENGNTTLYVNPNGVFASGFVLLVNGVQQNHSLDHRNQLHIANSDVLDKNEVHVVLYPVGARSGDDEQLKWTVEDSALKSELHIQLSTTKRLQFVLFDENNKKVCVAYVKPTTMTTVCALQDADALLDNFRLELRDRRLLFWRRSRTKVLLPSILGNIVGKSIVLEAK